MRDENYFENKVLGIFTEDSRLKQLQEKMRTKGLRGDEVYEFIHLDRKELSDKIKSLEEHVELKLYSRRKLERACEDMKEAISFALTQKKLDYGMPEEQAKEFRMRRVFSILEEALEDIR